MKRTLDLTYDEIVIGADLSALSYSYIKKAPIIYLRKLKPNIFDSEFEKWNQTMFFLSLHNLVPFPDVLQSIRFETDNILKVVTKQNFVISVNFKNCVISDDYNIFGINYTEKYESKENLVLDWFSLENYKNDNDLILSEDKFLKKIRFISNKEAIGYSYLNNEEINSGDFSEVVSRITFGRLLKQKAKIKISKREVFPLEKTKYEGLPENIKILNESPAQILKMESKKDEYFDYLERLINGTKINS